MSDNWMDSPIMQAAVIPEDDMSATDQAVHIRKAYWRIREVLDGPTSSDRALTTAHA